MSSFDWTRQISQIKRLELLTENEIKQICEKAKEIVTKESNLVYLQAPITVCGDIHGQFDDLLELFLVGGSCPETNYLFLGDFVDRGFNSVETFLLFLLLKIKYEDRITLLRGNHESRQITQVYGFYDECTRKFGSINVWRYCTEVFDCLPLAAIIDGKIFCVHGGLSPSLENINELENINRFQEIPHEGVMSDILWSDPEVDVQGYNISPRGAGFIFGEDTVKKFNQVNGTELVARAHQLIMEGYKMMFDDNLVTVWSAPNYCYRCGNVASIMEVDENLSKTFKIFESAPTEMRTQPARKQVPDYFL